MAYNDTKTKKDRIGGMKKRDKMQDMIPKGAASKALKNKKLCGDCGKGACKCQ